MTNSYIQMAEESLRVIQKIESESKLWLASTSYYTMYYCLYAIMIQIGIKCEIHKCTLECMKNLFNDFYDEKDVELLDLGFKLRNDLQYYPDRLVSNKDLQKIRTGAVDFFIKTKGILSMISNEKIKDTRKKLMRYVK